MEKKRILVVDDEESLCEILKFNLENVGYEVDTAFSAEEALAMDLSVYNLFILDVMMGNISGFQMADIVKKNKNIASVPIIFCTARDTEDDTVRGLNLGADDYVSKPFSIKEVIARVEAVLRRSQRENVNEAPESSLNYDKLILDMVAKKAYVSGVNLPLTKKEFEILSLFLQKQGRVFSREELLKTVWPDDVFVTDRTVDVHITRLRKKIVPYDKNIVTRLGYGYCFEM
ncbi:MAG: response regulator transcription factor [Tannerella sp.]|jgi:DNA-binding response OmpR family regulator|nr:response regulator transcription factor [Tannerella sp.]